MREQKRSRTETKALTRLIDVDEAAAYLSVAVSTVYGWVWQRRIPFVKIGRVLRFDLEDLQHFVEGNKQQPRKKVGLQ